MIGNNVLFLYNQKNEIISMIIYKIYKHKLFNILTIEEMCIIKKFKSNGYSKIMLNYLFETVKKKYNQCYIVSIICDIRSISNEFENYKIIYSYVENIKNSFDDCVVNQCKNIIKKWYMLELDKKNGIFFIPFYINNETYKIFNSNKYNLNIKQKKFKKILVKNKYSLGFGIGVFNIIKIS